jgi:formylglycine-generating enzyme required for sulfatase activity
MRSRALGQAQEDRDVDQDWLLPNSGGRTHPVGTKEKAANGLHDLGGNVQEMTYGGSALFGQARFGGSFADEPGVNSHPVVRMESPFVGRWHVGFSVEWRPETLDRPQ